MFLYANWIKSRKEQKANSEASYFKRFQKACLSGNDKETYHQLMSWLDRIYDGPRSATIWWFVNVTDSPELKEQVSELTRSLFAQEDTTVTWSFSHFYNDIAKARRSFLQKEKLTVLSHTGHPSLNP